MMPLSRAFCCFGLAVAVLVALPRASYAGGAQSKVDEFAKKALDHNHKFHEHRAAAKHADSRVERVQHQVAAQYNKSRAGRNARRGDAARYGKLQKYKKGQRLGGHGVLGT